jgi:hypothetical protein
VGTREESLLCALPVAVVASILIAWLILRSVFRREHPAKLVSASVLVVLYPYAVLLLYAIVDAISPVGKFDQWYVQLYILIPLSFASAILMVVLWLTVRPLDGKRYGAAAALALVIGICLVAWGHEQVSEERLRDGFSWATPVVMPVSFLVVLLILRSLFRPETAAKAVYAAVLIAHFACTMPPVAAVFYPEAPSGRWGAIFVDMTFFLLFIFLPAVFLLILWLCSFTRHSFPGERSYAGEAWMASLIGAYSVFWNADATWSTFDKL